MAGRFLWTFLALTCGLIEVPNLVSAQSLGFAGKQVVLTVRDHEGKLIDGARAVIQGTFVFYASPDGRIRILHRSGLRFPVAVEVSANGYRRRSITIQPNADARIDVSLEKIPQRIILDGRTVSVDELSGNNIQRAAKLQRKAAELLKAGKAAEARTLLFDAERLHPSSAAIKNAIGVTLLRERKFMQAAEWLENAYQTEPYNPHYTANLGLLRWMQRRYGECFALLQRAVELGCETESVHYLLGVLALREQDWKLSRKELSRIDASRFPYSNLFLSVALHRLHKSDDAVEKYQKFLERNPVPLVAASLP